MRHRYYTYEARYKVILDEITINECKPQIGFTTLYRVGDLDIRLVSHGLDRRKPYLIVRYTKKLTIFHFNPNVD